MEIYLQESSATIFFHNKHQGQRLESCMLHAANGFLYKCWRKCRFLPAAWFTLLAAKPESAQTGKSGRHGGRMDEPAYNDGPVKQDRQNGANRRQNERGRTPIYCI